MAIAALRKLPAMAGTCYRGERMTEVDFAEMYGDAQNRKLPTKARPNLTSVATERSAAQRFANGTDETPRDATVSVMTEVTVKSGRDIGDLSIHGRREKEWLLLPGTVLATDSVQEIPIRDIRESERNQVGAHQSHRSVDSQVGGGFHGDTRPTSDPAAADGRSGSLTPERPRRVTRRGGASCGEGRPAATLPSGPGEGPAARRRSSAAKAARPGAIPGGLLADRYGHYGEAIALSLTIGDKPSAAVDVKEGEGSMVIGGCSAAGCHRSRAGAHIGALHLELPSYSGRSHRDLGKARDGDDGAGLHVERNAR